MFRKIIKDRINRFKYYRLINNTGYDKEFSFSESVEHYKSKNEIYLYFCSYYEYRLPKAIKEHREYIEENNKGFGESAFHAMWWKLLLEFKPKNMLEIGVYRGQVISLWALISEMLHRDVDIHGISPFSSFGDSVSEYMKNLDYYQDVKSTFSELNLKTPTFTRGFSNEPQSVKAIKDKAWDLIYIDGGHDYEDVLFDYKICKENLKPGGLLVLDDASLYTDYRPESFSFSGHPGPSKVARDFAEKEMCFIGSVGHNNVYLKE